MMIAEVCRFYGWTDEYALKMPAKRFFVMREASRKIMSTELVHQCHIARSANLTNKGFEEVLDFFRSMGGPREVPVMVNKLTAPKQELKASSPEAKDAVMKRFAMDRRIHRQPRPRKGDKG